jgi:hypothetical protein
MFKIVVVIFIYYRHKPIDLIIRNTVFLLKQRVVSKKSVIVLGRKM